MSAFDFADSMPVGFGAVGGLLSSSVSRAEQDRLKNDPAQSRDPVFAVASKGARSRESSLSVLGRARANTGSFDFENGLALRVRSLRSR